MQSNQSLKSSFWSPIRESPAQPQTVHRVQRAPFPQRHTTSYCFCSTFYGCSLLLSHLPYINLTVWLPDPRGNHNIQAFFLLERQERELGGEEFGWWVMVQKLEIEKRRRGKTRCEKWRDWAREMHEK